MTARRPPRLQKAATVDIDDEPYCDAPSKKVGPIRRSKSISRSNSVTFEPFVTPASILERLIPILTVNSGNVYSASADNVLSITEKREINNDECKEGRTESHITSPLLPPTVTISSDSETIMINDDADLELEHNLIDDLQLAVEVKSRLSKQIIKKVAIGFCFSSIPCLLCIGVTQFTANALTFNPSSFYSPYFLLWFNTNWLVTFFPVYLIIVFTHSACFKTNGSVLNFKKLFRESTRMFGRQGLNAKSLALQVVPFFILWITFLYSFNQALGYISPGETAAVFASCSSFVYTLSWVFLQIKFVPIRIIAFLIAIIGIILMAHAEGIGTANFTGVIAAVISAAAAAIYIVLFMKLFGKVSLCQISMFTTLIGLCNLTLNWITLLVLTMTETEKIIVDEIPWGHICVSAALLLAFLCFLNLSSTMNKLFFVSIGLLVSVPSNAVADAIFRPFSPNSIHLYASACILTSYIILLLPEDFVDVLSNLIALKKPNSN